MKFLKLVEYFERLEATSKRLKMFSILSELFEKAGSIEIDKIAYLSQGQLLPSFHGLEIGMSEKYLIRAISDATNTPTKKVEDEFKETGDLGIVAEKLTQREGVGLSVSEVYDDLTNIAYTSGKGSIEKKVGLLVSLLNGASPKEAKYIARFVIGRLRLGIAEPSVLDALAQIELSEQLNIALDDIPQQSLSKKEERIEFFKSIKPNPELLQEVIRELKLDSSKKHPETDAEENKIAKEYFDKLMKKRQSICDSLEQAYNTCADIGRIAKTYKSEGIEGIKKIHVMLGYPIRMALCERVPSSEDIIEKMGKAAVEAKYDGFRVQIHKNKDHIDMFSRNLERTTHMFPEIKEAVRKFVKADTAIIEGEALAYNEATGELFSFQVTIQRKRKHGIEELAKEFPLKYFAFDLLYVDGEDYTQKPFEERRTKLEKMININSVIEPSELFITDKSEEITEYFDEAVARGLEGVVAKRLDAPYAAGSRNFNWIKLKRSYRGELADSIDVCIVGYFRGKGARAEFGVGALLGAVYDPKTDTFKTVSKIGSGFTEDELSQLKKMMDTISLKHKHPRVDSVMEADVWVEPRYVVTVNADEITRSPSHTAGKDKDGIGYALRFPRTVGFLRDDKKPEDANSVKEIIELYEIQKKVKVG